MEKPFNLSLEEPHEDSEGTVHYFNSTLEELDVFNPGRPWKMIGGLAHNRRNGRWWFSIENGRRFSALFDITDGHFSLKGF